MMHGHTIYPLTKHIRVKGPSLENPLDCKIEALQRLQKCITQDKAFLKEILQNEDKTEDLFRALKESLSS